MVRKISKEERIFRDTLFQTLTGFLLFAGLVLFVSPKIEAQEIIHKFKNPSFSGIS